jgi:hypothetical protein
VAPDSLIHRYQSFHLGLVVSALGLLILGWSIGVDGRSDRRRNWSRPNTSSWTKWRKEIKPKANKGESLQTTVRKVFLFAKIS